MEIFTFLILFSLAFFYIDLMQPSSLSAFPLNDEISRDAWSLQRDNQAIDKKNIGKDLK